MNLMIYVQSLYLRKLIKILLSWMKYEIDMEIIYNIFKREKLLYSNYEK